MNNITNLNKQQIQRGNVNHYSFFAIEGIITKYVSTKGDTYISDPNVVNRFIVNNPDNTLTDMGANQNDICIKNNHNYFFFTPEEDTVVILLELSQILHFKNNNWNVIYTFSSGGGGGTLVDEPPFDSNKYGRRNGAWIKLDDIPEAPITNRLYSRKNNTWELNPIQYDAPFDSKVYGRNKNTWIESVGEAPKDGVLYGRKDGVWEVVNIENSGLFVPEAPVDTNYYARSNKEWKVINVIPPQDSKIYGRINTGWAEVTDEAPKNNKLYGRKDGNWELITIEGGIQEAPIDGKYYSRKDGSWVETIFLLEAPINGLPYFRKDGNWEIFVDKSFEDVAQDNILYGRRNKRWEQIKSSPIENDAPQDNEIYGRKNGDWVKVEGGGGSGGGGLIGDHNTASNIQGGKIENGLTTEAYHLSYDEYNKIPYKPRILFPLNNAVNVNQVPQIEITHYQHPFEYSMLGLHLIIATNPNFTSESIIYEFNDVYGSNTFQIPLLNQNNENTLKPATTYYIRVRYRDNKKKYSLWSEVNKFETMIELPTQLLKRPMIVFPSSGGKNSNINPFFLMTQPEALIGAANFHKSDWEVATDIDFNNKIYDALEQDNLTYHRSTNLNLVASTGTTFYVRARQKTVNGDYTPWSIPVNFGLESTLSDYSSNIFGFRRIFNEAGDWVIYNIDENGDKINLPKSYFDLHPLYQNRIVDVPLDNHPNIKYKMTYIPPIYEKCNVYNDAYGNQVIDLWFSPYKVDNTWWIDPSFILAPGGFYISPNFAINRNYKDVVGEGIGTNYVSYPITMEEILADSAGIGCVYKFSQSSIQSSTGSINKLNDFEYNNIQNQNLKWRLMSLYEKRLLSDLIICEKLGYNFITEAPIYRNNNYFWGTSLSILNTLNYRILVSNCLGRKFWEASEDTEGRESHEISLSKPVNYNYAGKSGESVSNVVLFNSGIKFKCFINDGDKKLKGSQYSTVQEIYTGFNEDLNIEMALLGIPKIISKIKTNMKYPIKPRGSSDNIHYSSYSIISFYYGSSYDNYNIYSSLFGLSPILTSYDIPSTTSVSKLCKSIE